MLPNYLIICRSLTSAQRTAQILERSGVRAVIQRAPRHAAEEGCSHAVRVAEQQLNKALSILNRTELAPSRVFVQQMTGEYREVAL